MKTVYKVCLALGISFLIIITMSVAFVFVTWQRYPCWTDITISYSYQSQPDNFKLLESLHSIPELNENSKDWWEHVTISKETQNDIVLIQLPTAINPSSPLMESIINKLEQLDNVTTVESGISVCS